MKKSSLHLKKIWVFFGLVLLCCFVSLFFGLKVSAYSNTYTETANESSYIWLLPNSNLYTNDATTEYNLIMLYDTSENITGIIAKVYNSGTTATNYPYYIKLYNESNYGETIEVYPEDGYLFIYYDNPNKKIYFYQAYYNTHGSLEISQDSKLKEISLSYEFSHDNFDKINYYGLFMGHSLDGSSNFNMQSINWTLYDITRNPYELEGFLSSYQKAYKKAYGEGYIDGQNGENAISPVWNLFQGIFGTIGTIFSIELAPHVYLGYFFLVPLFFGVVGLILWIWRRN